MPSLTTPSLSFATPAKTSSVAALPASAEERIGQALQGAEGKSPQVAAPASGGARSTLSVSPSPVRSNPALMSTTTSTWNLTYRDQDNRLATEYTIASGLAQRTKDYFYFGNLLVATKDNSGTFLFYASDHLGSIRLVTSGAGSVQERHAYLPYGQEISPGASYQPLKFAAMERDASSNNDYDHARFHLNGMGRFLELDPVRGKAENPLTWNRYAYALGNPVRNTDPTGEDTVVELKYYILGQAPFQGDYGHQYVYLQDTDTGEAMISRAGPSSPYPVDVSRVASDSAAKAPSGNGDITLHADLTPEAKSVDADQAGKVVPGSATTVKSPIADVAAKLQTFNTAVDKAKIDYKPRSTNSNAYAGTAYKVVTGKAAPASPVLPGSKVNLTPLIPQCTSTPGTCGEASPK